MARTRQPSWKLIDNLGDKRPFEYGGYFVYRDETGVYPEEAELLIPDEEGEGDRYTIYRIVLDRLKKKDGYLVPYKYDATWPHPVAKYDEWFHKDLDKVASFVGASTKELEKSLTSKEPVERAMAYRAIGDYHGWDNLDSYPLTGLTRQEVEERYPEFVKS